MKGFAFFSIFHCRFQNLEWANFLKCSWKLCYDGWHTLLSSCPAVHKTDPWMTRLSRSRWRLLCWWLSQVFCPHISPAQEAEKSECPVEPLQEPLAAPHIFPSYKWWNNVFPSQHFLSWKYFSKNWFNLMFALRWTSRDAVVRKKWRSAQFSGWKWTFQCILLFMLLKKKFIRATKAPKRTLRLRVKFKINAVDPDTFNFDTL